MSELYDRLTRLEDFTLKLEILPNPDSLTGVLSSASFHHTKSYSISV